MRVVVYNVKGIETKSFTEKVELEKRFHCKADVILREIEEERPTLSPIRKAMLEQFGYVSASLRNKVVMP